MDPNPELMSVTSENLTLTDGNIYEQIYLDLRQDPDAPVLDCNSVQMEQFGSTTDGSLNIMYERDIPLPQEQMEYKPTIENNMILNSNATEDESMAVEALRQLGNSAVHTKIPPDLPLLPCSNCDIQFQTTADFQNHSAICKHTPLRCYVCNEAFERTVDFNNHVVGHAVDRPHSCRMCSMLFVQEKDLVEHLQSHASADTNQCKVCGVTFHRPSSLTNHMKIHTYQPGRAIFNSLVLPKVEVENCTSISDEINSKGITLPSLNNWEDYEFTRAEDFYVNLEVAQEMTIGNFEEGKNNEVAVSYEFVNDKSVGHEEEISSTEVIPPQTSPEVENKRPYLCKYCNKSFAREKALLSHHKLHSSILQNYYQCKNCDGCLTDEESLTKHSSTCGEKVQQSNEKILNVNAPKNDLQNVEKQRSRVLIDNPKSEFYKHICTHCEKRFSTKQKLHRHMWIHRKKTFSCEICASSFEKQEELDTHRLSTHQGNSAYVCSECGKCFSSRQGLWEHNRVHGETSHLYKCVECTKTFSSRQGYLIHKRAHNDERPYGCRFCWKSFRDGGTLRKHERIHTGERPHACPLCTRAFNQKVVLREHVRWLHAANRQPNENGVYDCIMCEQKLSDKDDLCAHIVKHSDHLALLAKDASKKNIKLLSNSTDTNKGVRKHNNVKDNNKVIIEIIPAVNTNSNLLIEDVKPLIKCDLCGDKFLNEDDLSEHVRIHI